MQAVMGAFEDGVLHHFGGPYTRALLNLLQDNVTAAQVNAVLSQAGETRSIEVLSDDATWSSYAQFKALLCAAAKVLDSPERLAEVGLRLQEIPDLELAPALHALGSPEELYANGATGTSLCPIQVLDATKVADREWLVTQTFVGEFEPFPELCAVHAGVQQLPVLMFGYPAPQVVEEQCVCRGDAVCVFRVRWDAVNEAERRANFLEARFHALESRLEQFECTVAELVSGQDLQTMLTRTFLSASRAMRSPICLLALDAELPEDVHRVYSTGVFGAEAEELAGAILASSDEVSGRLITEVASTRRQYGRLAALRPNGGFRPRELTRLKAYASFVAAALDSATALADARRQEFEARRQEADARRQGDSARALLELSTALAEITTVEDMTARLVRAVPLVMACDRALVALTDENGEHPRVVTTFGYPAELEQLLLGSELPATADEHAIPQFHQQDALPPGESMKETGTKASLHIPIVVDGSWAGTIIAAVVSDPDRLRPDRENEERLRGLAAQAATAIRNARLLDQVRHQSLHDPLTGLPNRALILDRVDRMLARARRHHHAAAAMFIDLDGFKEINDSFGHAAGDELLRAVTDRLTGALRPSDTVGRLGGDEFVVLVDGASLDAGPELIAERLLAVLREPFRMSNAIVNALSVTASIGIATGDRPSAGDLLRDADVALYQAKAAGKNRFLVFEERMQTVVHDRLLLQMDLQNALELGQFFLVYQPICHLVSGVITGAEALLRWQHPTRGEIQPNDFISLLEETGLILDVGRWVLHEACRQAVVWRELGLPIDIAVNVSGRQLQTDEFLTGLDEVLRITGLDPNALVVEITESTMMIDVHATSARLRAIRSRGVRIAIDDFGTGYSSLAVLRDFPVDTLKIDRAFVSGIGDTNEAAALIHSLIQLGKSLGLTTVAEGIEDTTQYAHLEGEECESGQGFLIARPMPAAQLERVLAAGPTRFSAA